VNERREKEERDGKNGKRGSFFSLLCYKQFSSGMKDGVQMSRVLCSERGNYLIRLFFVLFLFFWVFRAAARASARAPPRRPRPCQRWPPWPAPPACRRTPRGSRTARPLGAGPRTPAGAARPARAAQPLPGRRDASSRGRRRLQRRGQEEKKGRPGLLLLPTRLKGPRARRRGKGTRLSPRGCA